MSNLYLPPEILDYIAKFLHDDPNTLRDCCLVSQSWVPRARKHLFADVGLRTEENLESWKRLFSDPSTSPAHFAKSLYIGCALAVTAADAEAGSWLKCFVRIAHLRVEAPEMYLREPVISLIPFCRLLPTVKSLHVKSAGFPPSRIFDLIRSFPLLEDLAVAGNRDWVDDGDSSDGPLTFDQSSNPPALSGSLKLCLDAGMKPISSRLLSIPGGIHFRKLTLTWHRREDLLSILELVGKCSHTLESLDITCYQYGDLGLTSVDLSKATGLKDVTFRINSSGSQWVTIALRTITPKHRDLRRISISATYFSALIGFGANIDVQEVEKRTVGQWLELDRLLAQLWESYSNPPKIMCRALLRKEKNVRDLMGRLLPEATRGGTVNLFDAL